MNIGTEYNKSLIINFSSNNNGFIFIYNKKNKKSFEKIINYSKLIQESYNNFYCVWVRNKMDEKALNEKLVMKKEKIWQKIEYWFFWNISKKWKKYEWNSLLFFKWKDSINLNHIVILNDYYY